jgi:hypothetical protein
MTLVKPPYHVGMVVPDVPRAMEELTEVLGVSWGRVQRRQNTMDTPQGPAPTEVCFAYTLDGPPYLEVIEQRPGTVFATLGLHHLGLWTDDQRAESTRLGDAGWPRETVSVLPDGTWGGGLYHVGLDCVRLELVDISRSEPRLRNYLAGGDYDLPDVGGRRARGV